MKRIGLIPRSRLKNLPDQVWAHHELCFFLHDECVRALVDYENSAAHLERIEFSNPEEFSRFEAICENTDTISALRELGYDNASKRVILNTICIAMISDCLHHVYEGLRCFEKRKFLVGFNLLRKPLTENLLYLSWMYGNPDEFYARFTMGDPTLLTLQVLGEKRKRIYVETIEKLEHNYLFDANHLDFIINSKRKEGGFQKFFQHAVHLITTWKEIRTPSENFNFIFKNPADDDIYDFVYQHLPYVLLFMSHVFVGIFDRTQKMDETSKNLFHMRTMLAHDLISGADERRSLSNFEQILTTHPYCSECGAACKITLYNAVSMLLVSKFRCATCRTVHPFLLFSYPDLQQ